MIAKSCSTQEGFLGSTGRDTSTPFDTRRTATVYSVLLFYAQSGSDQRSSPDLVLIGPLCNFASIDVTWLNTRVALIIRAFSSGVGRKRRESFCRCFFFRFFFFKKERFWNLQVRLAGSIIIIIMIMMMMIMLITTTVIMILLWVEIVRVGVR